MQNYQTAQAYPMQQLAQLKALSTGLPMTDVTTTQQAATPSTLGTLAGLGTAGVGIAGALSPGVSPTINVAPPPAAPLNYSTQKKGGIIKKKKTKKYSEGGLVELSLYNVMKGSL